MEPQNSALCYEMLDLALPRTPIPRWHLDTPVAGAPCERIGLGRFRLRGWMLPNGTCRLGIAVRANGLTRAYPLNEQRGDVILKVLQLDPADHPELFCGFDLALPEVREFDIGLDLDGTLVWLKRLRLVQPIGATGGGAPR